MGGGPAAEAGMTVDDHETRAVAAITDPIERNLAITRTYHRLAVAMRDVVGPHDATWCAFAVWASKTAGTSIRMEEIPAAVRCHLEGSPTYQQARTALGHHLEHGDVLQLVDQAAKTVSADIAGGNALVFSELAPVFVALIEGRDEVPAGTPPEVVSASAAYRAARDESDPNRRAQLVLLANLVAVLHEQTRLQDAIAGALDAAPTIELEKLARHRLLAGAAHELHACVDPLGAELERAWEAAVTDLMMTLTTADETLRLHRDVPPPPGRPLFPDELRPPFAITYLAAFCEQYDHTRLSGTGSGARDWRDLGQRMTYILNLFRSRQRHAPLFEPPFPDGPPADPGAPAIP